MTDIPQKCDACGQRLGTMLKVVDVKSTDRPAPPSHTVTLLECLCPHCGAKVEIYKTLEKDEEGEE